MIRENPASRGIGDELTISGRDAVSSSSAVVSDRVGSLSYRKPDHPTLNAAAALRPNRANCRWRSVPQCADPWVQTTKACRRHLFPNPGYLRTEGQTQIAL